MQSQRIVYRDLSLPQVQFQLPEEKPSQFQKFKSNAAALVFKGYGAAEASVEQSVTLLSKEITKLSKAVGNDPHAKQLMQHALEMTDGAKAMLDDARAGMVAMAKSAGKSAGSSVESAKKEMDKTMKAVMKMATAAYQEALKAVKERKESLPPGVQVRLDEAMTGVSAAYNAVSVQASKASDIASQFISDKSKPVIDKLKPIIQDWLDSLTQQANQAMKSAKAKCREAKLAVKNALISLENDPMETISKGTKRAWSAAEHAIKKAKEALKAAGKIISQVLTELKKFGTDPLNYIHTHVSNAGAKFNELVSDYTVPVTNLVATNIAKAVRTCSKQLEATREGPYFVQNETLRHFGWLLKDIATSIDEKNFKQAQEQIRNLFSNLEKGDEGMLKLVDQLWELHELRKQQKVE
jgi:hypothetical protein